MATFSLVASAWKSTKIILVRFFASSTNSSTFSNGQLIIGINVRPWIEITATSCELNLTKVKPFPGFDSGKFAGRTNLSASSIKSKIERLSHVWFPSVTTLTPCSNKNL